MVKEGDLRSSAIDSAQVRTLLVSQTKKHTAITKFYNKFRFSLKKSQMFLVNIFLLLWPSWLRRRAYNAEIVGSSPTRSILKLETATQSKYNTLFQFETIQGPIAQLVRAFDC